MTIKHPRPANVAHIPSPLGFDGNAGIEVWLPDEFVGNRQAVVKIGVPDQTLVLEVDTLEQLIESLQRAATAARSANSKIALAGVKQAIIGRLHDGERLIATDAGGVCWHRAGFDQTLPVVALADPEYPNFIALQELLGEEKIISKTTIIGSVRDVPVGLVELVLNVTESVVTDGHLVIDEDEWYLMEQFIVYGAPSRLFTSEKRYRTALLKLNSLGWTTGPGIIGEVGATEAGRAAWLKHKAATNSPKEPDDAC